MKKILLLLVLTLTSLIVKPQAKYYLSMSVNQPWGTATNINAMNQAFGVGTWTQAYYSSVNVTALLQPTVCFIFMEGGDSHANALNAFLIANLPAIQTWVSNGGRLLINAAPNQGTNINYGFGGVLLTYPNFSTPGTAVNPLHPIFVGPALPCGTAFTGTWWSHAIVSGGGITNVINGTGGSTLGELNWGAGKVMFGGMTTPNWHSPALNAANLLSNILTYMYVCCTQPTITAVASPTAICAGKTTTLTASGAGIGGTYTWTPPAPGLTLTGNTVTFSPTVTTIYTVAGTNTAGCIGTKTIQVIVNPNPTITTIATSNSICLGQTSATITMGGGISYTTQPINFTGTSVVVSPAIPTIYTVTGVNANGCVNTTTFQIGINPTTTATANSPSSCVGTPINFIGGGGVSYLWLGPNGFTSNIQNPTIPSASLNMTGQYTLIATSALGCSNTAISNVIIAALPTPNISSNAPLCIGGTLNLTGTGGGTYLWAGPNGFVSAIQTPSIGNVNLLANGIYSLVTTVNTCSAITTASIIINPLPSPILLNNSPVCLYQAITFTGTGGITYTITGPNGYISNNPNATIPVANNIAAGVYTITATDINNCTNSNTSTLLINPLPIVSVVGSTICANKTISLSVSGGTAFIWSGPNGFNSTAQNILISNATTNMSGQYTVNVISANGCISNSITNVLVNSLPTPTAGNSSPVCIGKSVRLNSGDPNGDNYSWSGPNGFYSSMQNLTISNTELNMSGLYTVTVTNLSGCSGVAMTAIVINPLPNASIVSNISKGCAPVCMNFSCQTTFSLQNYVWQVNNELKTTSPSFNNCFSRAGTYTINTSFTDQNGCSNRSANYEVDVYPVPTADFNFEPGRPIINDNIDFIDATYNASIKDWIWFFTNQENNTKLSQNVRATYADAGSYPIALIVFSDKGCSDTIVKSITIGEDFDIFIPKTFTPNGDGVNDTFQPKGFGIAKYEMSIYDRWGSKIFSTSDFNQGWSGNVQTKGKEIVQDGVYVWRIQLTNILGKSKELTGTVSLLK